MTHTLAGVATPSPDEMPLRCECTTYIIDAADFVVTAITTSSDHTVADEQIGHPLTEQWPHASSHLTALLTQVGTTGLPAAMRLPAAAPDLPQMECVCVPLRNAQGAVTQIACTWVHDAVPAEDDVTACLARLDQAITTAMPLHTILDLVIDEAHSLIHADSTQIALVNMTMPRDLRCEVGRGVGRAAFAGLPLAHSSLAAQVLERNQPQRLAGAKLAHVTRQMPDAALLRRFAITSWLGVPLRVGGQAIGVMMAQRVGDATPFAATDEARLQRFAAGVSVALASARLREAEAEEAQREMVLGRLLENLPVGVLWLDAELRVLYANHLEHVRLGYRMGDSVHIGPGEFHPTWRDAVTKAPYRWEDLPFIRTIRSGHSIEALLALAATDGGAETEFIVKTHPSHDAQGNVTDVILVWIDVTAQRQASREAIRRAAELDIIIESIADGVIIYNRDGEPLRYNPAALEILGWQGAGIDPVAITAAERFGTYDLRYLSGELVPPDELPVAQALAGQITAPIPLVSRRADGAEVIKSIRAAPLREPTTGAIQGAVIVFRDVTEVRRVEQMKEDFINLASHELRAPLEPLMLASNFIQRWIDRPERAADVARLSGEVMNHTRRIGRLVVEMLDMSRITSGHFTIAVAPSDLTRTVLDAIDDQRLISHRTITTAGLDAPLCCVADSERIWQVMTNLLANATKYSAAPAPIEVTATIIPPPDVTEARRVQFMVRDHGSGIAREHLPHIFSRFYRIMRPESQQGAQMRDGLGLGLYISHAIVTAHGGHIWAESVVGKGSAFFVELPMCDDQAWNAIDAVTNNG